MNKTEKFAYIAAFIVCGVYIINTTIKYIINWNITGLIVTTIIVYVSFYISFKVDKK